MAGKLKDSQIDYVNKVIFTRLVSIIVRAATATTKVEHAFLSYHRKIYIIMSSIMKLYPLDNLMQLMVAVLLAMLVTIVMTIELMIIWILMTIISFSYCAN